MGYTSHAEVSIAQAPKRIEAAVPLVVTLLLQVVVLAAPLWAATAFVRGDANGDGEIDVSDPVRVLLVLFVGETPTVPLDAFDVDDDGSISITDAIHLLRRLFAGGPPPAAPFPKAGLDPTPNDPYTEGDAETPLADLAVADLFLGPDNALLVSLENMSDVVVPAGETLVRVFVDGLPAWEHRIEEPFAGGELPPLDTGLRLGGVGSEPGGLRRVAAIVDPDGEVPESNEFQNSRHYSVAPPPRDGPDLVVSDLVARGDGEGGFEARPPAVRIENLGSSASPADLDVSFSVTLDGSPAGELHAVLPPIEPGGAVEIITEPALRPAVGARVIVRLVVSNASADLDNTDNVYEEVFPNGASLERYLELLASARIATSIVWEGSGGVRDYRSWSAAEQESLLQEIAVSERVSPLDRPLPPPLVDASLGSFSAESAWQIFLRHVAHSLWIEVNRLVAWRLADFPDEQLARLLDGRTLLEYVRSRDQYRFAYSVLGYTTAWNPRIPHHFLTNLGMVRPTQRETIFALTDWMRGYLIHISSADDVETLYGYAGWPPVDRVLYSLRTPHKSPGCHGCAGIYAGVLRAVNIPVVRRTVLLSAGQCTSAGAGHSRPEFPSVGLSMPHGDDPYNATLRPSGEPVPSSELFFSMEAMDELFLDPEIECSTEGWCNGLGGQASVNATRIHLRTAYEYGALYLLETYARYGPAYLDDTLRGSRVGGDVIECATPFFPAEERAAMVAGVEERLRAIGGGDLEAGKDAVLRLSSAFGQLIWP